MTKLDRLGLSASPEGQCVRIQCKRSAFPHVPYWLKYGQGLVQVVGTDSGAAFGPGSHAGRTHDRLQAAGRLHVPCGAYCHFIVRAWGLIMRDLCAPVPTGTALVNAAGSCTSL